MTRLPSRRVLLALAAGAACMGLVVSGSPSVAATTEPPPQPATSRPSESPTEEGEQGDAGEEAGETVAEVPADPLRVVIERLTPSSLPARGDVRVSGTITNESEEEWTDLGVYLFTSFEPMTTTAELEAAVTSDPRTDVGARIVDPGLFVDAPDLAPGGTTSFDLSVPVDQLLITGAPGVYWIGIHVLGTSSLGRLEGADGRARTFLPLVPPANAGTELALGLQFRNHIVRAPDGRLEFIDGWQSTLGKGGRLRRLLDLASSAPADQPISWVLDPAVVDAAISVSQGNPPVDLVDSGEEQAGTETEVEAEVEVEADGDGEEADPDSQPAPAPEGDAAGWVEDFFGEAGRHSLLTLPYGDLDVSSVTRHGVSDLLTSAFGSSTLVLAERGRTSTPVLLPPSGALAPVAFPELEPGLPVVLAPGAVADSTAGPLLNRVDGGRILIAPGPGGVWGPGPGAARSALAVRQRMLADAALHALSGDRDEPLVRFLPPGWDPGRNWQRARFFDGFDVPWLTGVDVADLLSELSIEPAVDPAEDLAYSEGALEAELPLVTVLATEALIAEGSTLEEMVTQDSGIDEQISRQALLTSSFWSRQRPGVAAARAVDARDRVSGWLDEVSVRAPSFVTMSSETGTFQVTVVNGLDQTVTVGLRASVPGDDLELQTPREIELAPNSRGAMRIDAEAANIGVHLVTLQPVSTEGTPLGEPTTVSIRSSRVGFILWIVMAVGGTALFVAIGLRIWRRVRRRRRTHGPVLSQVRP